MSTNSNEDVIEVASHDLFAVGDVVEITAPCMTKGKRGVIAAYHFGKWEISFSPQWVGWYPPEDIRKISPSNDQAMASAAEKTPTKKTTL